MRLHPLDLGQHAAVDLGAARLVERGLDREDADVLELVVRGVRGGRAVGADDVAEEPRGAPARRGSSRAGRAPARRRRRPPACASRARCSPGADPPSERPKRNSVCAGSAGPPLLVEGAAGQRAESPRDQRFGLGGGDVAGDRDDQVLRAIERLEEGEQVGALDVAQHLVRADPPALDAVLREGGREHALEGDRRRVVELAVRLLDDDLGLLRRARPGRTAGRGWRRPGSRPPARSPPSAPRSSSWSSRRWCRRSTRRRPRRAPARSARRPGTSSSP